MGSTETSWPGSTSMAGFSASSMDDGELTPSPSTRPGLFFPVRKTPSHRERARSVTSSTRAFMSAFGEEKRFLRIFLRPLAALRSTRTATRSPSRAVPRWLGLSSSSGTASVSHPRAAAAGSPFLGRKRILPERRMRIMPCTRFRRSRFKAYLPFCRRTSFPSSSIWSTRARKSSFCRESTFRARASSDLLWGS